MKEGRDEEERKPKMERGVSAQEGDPPSQNLMQRNAYPTSALQVMTHLANLSLSLNPPDKGKTVLDLNAEPPEDEAPVTVTARQDDKLFFITLNASVPGSSSLYHLAKPSSSNELSLFQETPSTSPVDDPVSSNLPLVISHSWPPTENQTLISFTLPPPLTHIPNHYTPSP